MTTEIIHLKMQASEKRVECELMTTGGSEKFTMPLNSQLGMKIETMLTNALLRACQRIHAAAQKEKTNATS